MKPPVAAYPGPVITRYEIEPAVGVKGSQIVNLAKDLARALSLVSIRVVETIPGKNLMGLELPNPRRQVVKLSEILGSAIYNESHSLLTLGLARTSRASRWCSICAHAASDGGGYDRFREIGRHQRDDSVDSLQGRSIASAHDPDRPEDAGAFGV